MAGKTAKSKIPSRPRGRPRPEETAQIESKLLAVALEEFLEHGYGDAAMARIAQAAGGSKTTLYSRYPSKAELFQALIFDQVERASPETALTSESGPLTLAAGLKSYARHMLRHSLQEDIRRLNQLIISESYRFPELGVATTEKTAMGIRRITDFIRETQAREGRRCRKPGAVAEAFIFMIRGWYLHVLLNNQEIALTDMEQWVDRSVDALLLSHREW